MGRKLLLMGGGGHCHSVLDSVLALGVYDEIGIVDQGSCSSCMGVSVVGIDEDIPQLMADGWSEAFITVGSIGDTKTRRRLFSMIKKYGLDVPAIIDPTATVSKWCKIGEGAFVGKRAVINTGSSIGSGSIVNTGAVIEHDCKIGDFAHISPGSVLCGHVTIGNDSHIGAGSIVRQQIFIAANCFIGAGSVVVKDIPANVKAYGNPCKVIE